MVPGEADLARDGIPRAFDGPADVPTYRFVRGEESKPDKSTVIAPGVPALLAFKELAIRPVALPPVAWQPERQPWVLDAHIALAKCEAGAAEAALAKANEKLAEAKRLEPSPDNTYAVESAKDAIAVAAAEVKVATLSLELARADAASVERRAEAMRASWSNAANAGDAADAAAQVEREAAAVSARRRLAAIELRLLRAPADKRGDLEKEVTTSRELLDKAEKAALEPSRAICADCRGRAVDGDAFSRLGKR